MKGIRWNGDAIATKGMTSSSSRGMFSVGNLVAFETHGYCSPDGRQSSGGCRMSTGNYLLQDEIKLNEFDNTHINRYGSGACDKQEVFELNNRFYHRNYGNEFAANYLFAILDDDRPRLPKEVCKTPDIAEIRKHQGKFLHIYSIGDYKKIAEKASSFEDAVEKICENFNSIDSRIEKLKKNATEKRNTLSVNFTTEGIEAAMLEMKKNYDKDCYWSESWKKEKLDQVELLQNSIDDLNSKNAIVLKLSRPYYSKPRTEQVHSDENIGILSLGSDDHFGNAVRSEDLVVKKVTKKIKTSAGLYCGSLKTSGGVIDIFDSADEGIRFRTNRYESWCNSQEWHEQVSYDIIRFEIESGEEGSMKEYNGEAKKRITNRKEKFENLSAIIRKAFGEDILKLANRKRGETLATLTVISKFSHFDRALIGKAMWETSSPVVLENLLILIDSKITESRAKRANKGYAWTYLNAVLPEVSFIGNFSDASKAIKIYLEKRF